MEVSTAEYPKHIAWELKSFSMPNIPRGTEGMLESLRSILKRVQANATPSELLSFEGSTSKIDLGTACIRLRPMKLVVKTRSGWSLSEEAEKWLNTGDDLYLAAFLCSRIKFLGEILYYLDEPKTAAQLQEIAVTEYALTWKTKSDINARLVWLRQFGLVEFQDFSLLYSITEKGKEFLKALYIEEPVKAECLIDETSHETELEISDWAIERCQKASSKRKASIGYVVGDVKQIKTTISEFVQLLEGGREYEQIQKYAAENYAISASSTKSFLTTLSNMNMAERKTNVIYDITSDARLWREKEQILDLVCMMHHSFFFVLEMLAVLREKDMSYKELAATAKVSYGFERENVDEIRKRIAIFKAAKLVRNASADRFTLTNRAILLLEFLGIERLSETESMQEENAASETGDSKFFAELRVAAKDSGNFENLERLVKIAFEKLGFEAKWIGGAGNTDVMIRAAGTASTAFSVTVDAKSTMTGNVTDGLVDFDTLKEHRKKHKADFSAIVGGSFQSERLINRAIEHGVVLIDVDTLQKLISGHAEVPINVTAYKALFEKPGLADISCLDEMRREISRCGDLLHSIMDCLIAVQEDPVYKGVLQERDIYGILRVNKNFTFVPSLDEISAMLQFLSSPLIGCVEKSKDGYCAVGTLQDAAMRFRYFSSVCERSLRV